MIIRKAINGEDRQVLLFYYNLIDQMKDQEYRPSWTKGVYPVLEDIHDAMAHEELYVAIQEGVIAGAFILNHQQGDGYDEVSWPVKARADKVAVIHLLAVHPAIQGQGTGTALLRKAVELSREAGDKAIRLDTLPWNLPARRMYESMGFRHCGDVELTYPTTGTVPFSMYELKLSGGKD